VTDENASVRVLILVRRFSRSRTRRAGRSRIVQERAVHAARFGPHRVFSMNVAAITWDGAVLIAPPGRVYVYTTFAFFRELPPGTWARPDCS
jgi:hypothetical protein